MAGALPARRSARPVARTPSGPSGAPPPHRRAPGGALRPSALTVERPRRPRRRRPRRLLVRLDPAGVGPRRGADGLPHRGPPDRPGPARARLGQRHRCCPPARPSSPTGDRPSPPTRRTSGRCRPRGAGGRWGPVSAPARFTTALRAADWQAQWLQPAGASQQPDRVTYLRTEVTPAAGTLRRATAYVSAAHTYRLYVDGAPVDAWPSFSYPDEQYARAVDLTGALAGGRTSAIGVLHRWYGPGQGRPASAPGLLFQLSLHYDDGRHDVVVSDASWRERPAEWLPSPQRNPDGGDFVEWVDGREHPQGWSDPGYDDSTWSPVTVIGPAGTAPFTTTYAQRTTIREIARPPREPAHGRRRCGRGGLRRRLPGAAADSVRPGPGREHHLHAGGLPARSGRAGLDAARHAGDQPLVLLHHGAGGHQAFEAFTYFGYRYVQIDNPGQALSRDQIVAITRRAAMPDVPTATFSSDNRMLNAVWRLMARSCLYCSQEQFVDTPTREKGQFLWDAANESEAVMRVYGDQNMSWQALRDVARGQARYWPNGCVNAIYPNDDGARFFGTSTARYAEWLWRYYVSTGDTDTAVRLYPSVTRAADWLWSARQGGNGLLYGLADTSDGDPVYGYDLSVAADTASNVLAVNAFNRVAQLAGLAGDAAGAAAQRARAVQLAGAVNAALRRADGVYVDGVDADGAQSAQRLAGGQRAGARLRRGPGGRRGNGRRLRAQPRHRPGTQPRPRAHACARGSGPARGHGAHAHRHLHSGLGPHRGGRRDLHLGGMEAERPDRRLHVARLGLLRPGGHAGDPPRGEPRGAGRRRHGPGGGVAAFGRPRPRRGLGADGRGPCPRVLAAARPGHDHGPDGAGQCGGDGAPARQRGRRACARAAPQSRRLPA